MHLSLQDLKDLKLTKNPAFKDSEHTGGDVGDGSSPYICPISGLEMSGKFRFIFLWSCGCVLAERALKEVKQNLCHMVSCVLNRCIFNEYPCLEGFIISLVYLYV